MKLLTHPGHHDVLPHIHHLAIMMYPRISHLAIIMCSLILYTSPGHYDVSLMSHLAIMM